MAAVCDFLILNLILFLNFTVADKTGAQNFFSAFNYHYLLMVIAIVMEL
jgi:hypothetical protein